MRSSHSFDETRPPVGAPWRRDPERIRIARFSPGCRVLGPGLRAVVWVQGCPLRCRECVVPEMLPFEGGKDISVHELARRLIALPDVEGVTFSGGEPTSQSAAIVRVLGLVRAERDFSCMIYSGFTYEKLLRDGDDDQRRLLSQIDILVDGPYLPERHTDLRWRGSSNQRVLFLSERYRSLQSMTEDRGHWLEFEYLPEGDLRWAGIPRRGFRRLLEEQLKERGIRLETSSGSVTDEASASEQP
ncbi:MAG: radical SAM protein [Planctomycetaceae bacterium]|nr:radical SAM protein [Planctomycetaceae bacterium]